MDFCEHCEAEAAVLSWHGLCVGCEAEASLAEEMFWEARAEERAEDHDDSWLDLV